MHSLAVQTMLLLLVTISYCTRAEYRFVQEPAMAATDIQHISTAGRSPARTGHVDDIQQSLMSEKLVDPARMALLQAACLTGPYCVQSSGTFRLSQATAAMSVRIMPAELRLHLRLSAWASVMPLTTCNVGLALGVDAAMTLAGTGLINAAAPPTGSAAAAFAHDQIILAIKAAFAQLRLGIKVPVIEPYDQATGFTTHPQLSNKSYWIPCHHTNVQQFHSNDNNNRKVR